MKRKITIDHATICKWVEDRQGKPATIGGTGGAGTGILRVRFPSSVAARLEEIEWDEFFQKFDEKGLVFLYQELASDGRLSTFHKITYPARWVDQASFTPG